MYYTGPFTARVECTGRYNPSIGLEVTCLIDDDVTGNGITSIIYQVNGQGEHNGEYDSGTSLSIRTPLN